MAHKMVNDFRKDLGVLAFTFWVEVFVGLMLTPWAPPRLTHSVPAPLPTALVHSAAGV